MLVLACFGELKVVHYLCITNKSNACTFCEGVLCSLTKYIFLFSALLSGNLK